MGYTVQASAPFEAVVEVGITGLVGTIAWRIEDGQGTIIEPAITTGIFEAGVSGVYTGMRTAPVSTGQFTIVWSDDGTFTADHSEADDLLVVPVGTSPDFPPIPPDSETGAILGPCNAWTTGAEVAACCTTDVGTFTSLLDDVAISASLMLWELSGRQFSGTCTRTVRPCTTWHTWGWQVLPGSGYLVGWADSFWSWYAAGGWFGGQQTCGCRPLSQTLLPGYPVRTVGQVKIDGSVVDPTTYRLDDRRWLVRTPSSADPDTALYWPSCQNLDRADTEPGTFSVTYSYGQNPPPIGIAAAGQLACELYKACHGQACALPAGTVRVTRQGVQIEKLAFTSFAFQSPPSRGPLPTGWRTGLNLVDLFLNTYSRHNMTRRPGVWAPELKYAKMAGVTFP